MLQAVVFDWGGTLTLPLEPDLYREDAWEALAGHMSPERANEIARHFQVLEQEVWELARTEHRSSRIADLVRSAASEFRLELAETAVEEAVGMHLGKVGAGVVHDPDAVRVLGALRERGLRLGLLSNTLWPHEFHEELLERDGLQELLDARVYTSEIEVTKPHPDAFLMVLRELKVDDPAHAAFVGDRPWDDIYGASKAGLKTVLRPNPLAPPHEIEPDATIENLGDLLPLVDDWMS